MPTDFTPVLTPAPIRIFKPGSPEFEEVVIQLPKYPGYETLSEPIRRYLLQAGAPLIDGFEHVSVRYHGERVDMFVDEMGALHSGAEYPLPVNEAATEIYWEASIVRGVSRRLLTHKIHGPALVFMRRVWF